MYQEQIAQLVPACPPLEAVKRELIGYRLVKNVPPTEADFLSHSALGKRRPPDVDECRWRSCSLFITPSKLLDIKGLPRIKGGQGIVRVSIEASSGPVHQKGDHVDWWRYRTFNVIGNCSVERVFP